MKKTDMRINDMHNFKSQIYILGKYDHLASIHW